MGSQHQHRAMLPSVSLIRTEVLSAGAENKGIVSRLRFKPCHLRQRMQRPRKSGVV